MASTAAADCSNPAGKEAALIYNNDYHLLQFCNGTSWMAVGPVSSSMMAAPSHPGYFVLTAATWTGNLGGLSGADAKCLTKLTTNHTTWKGYPVANANGQLTASRVHAFLCTSEGGQPGYPVGGRCNALQPNTTYAFAYAGDASKGGATSTIDAERAGPHDNADWSDAAHFGVATQRWDDRFMQDDGAGGYDSTVWGLNNWTYGEDCDAWTRSTSAYVADAPMTNATDTSRWYTNGGEACNKTHRLICYVNP